MNATSSPTVWASWRNRILRTVIGVAALALLALLLEAAWTLRSAGHFFLSFESVTPGKTTLSEAQTLLHYPPFTDQSSPCNDTRCMIGFNFEARLSRWGLLRPRRGLQGFVDIRGGTVEFVRFVYGERAKSVVAVTEGPDEANPSEPYMAVGLTMKATQESGTESVARVANFADLPIAYRQRLLQPNVWCLIKFSGCSSVREILPGSSALNFVGH
jgi:hypothetical protein